MIAFEERIEVEVTPAEAFDRLADMTELQHWTQRGQLDPDPPQLLRPLAPLSNAGFQRQARAAVEGARRYLATSLPG